MSAEGSLYASYRTLGLVCDGATPTCAPTVHQLGTATFITTPTSAGTSLHLYDAELQLKRVSKPFPRDWQALPHMSHIVSTQHFTFLALGSSIAGLENLRPAALWKLHDAPVTALAVVADLLISTCEQSRLVAVTLPSRPESLSSTPKISADITLPQSFVASHIVHPPTYFNKVLLGARDGRLLLVNLRTRRIIHTFSGFNSPVTALVPSPVPDVVAIATQSRDIYVHNIRFDETVTTFCHASSWATHVSFRTDSVPTLVSADKEGNLYVWDLSERSLRTQTANIHPGGFAYVGFLPSEPILVTAGVTDNALKLHVFDTPDGAPRLLRAREGHRLPPTLVRFSGRDGCMMISSGLDRELRLVSVVREARNREFAQRVVEKRGGKARKRRRVQAGVEKGDRAAELGTRLPPVVYLATNELRQRDGDFANVVTVHEGLEQAYTWRVQDGASAAHVLEPPIRPEMYRLAFKGGKEGGKEGKGKKVKRKTKPEDKVATCVVITPCANYAVVGSRDGRMHAYNMQSGRHQGEYKDSTLKPETGTESLAPTAWGHAHESAIVDLAVDACGDALVSAAAADNTLKFWSLHARRLDGNSITTLAAISKVTWCKASDLLAVACHDFSIYVYDASTRKLARSFDGHRGFIADLCFDPPGRRVLSASMDGTVRTWDLPSGRIIDTLNCGEAPTSIAVAATGEYLATTHVNSLGISLWVDKTKFGSLLSHMDEGGEEDVEEDATIAVDDEQDSAEEIDLSPHLKTSDPKVSSDLRRDERSVPKALSKHVATLSSKPITHWSLLSNLQAIKERNKPREPAKKPESAPFFLPTVKGLKLQFDTSQTKDGSLPDEHDGKAPKMSEQLKGAESEDDWANSEFGRLVAKEKYGSAAVLLRELDASGVDLQIRTVHGKAARRNAAIFFTEQLGNPHEYELTQAHLSVFLGSQGTLLARDEDGTSVLQGLLEAQDDAWQRLRSSFDSVLNLSGHFSGQV